MPKIGDIYTRYKIMPALQMHQLRVAAVASQICDSLSVAVDKNSVVQACLLHDMGNIIKFDLAYFPQFLEPEGLDYWRTVQDEFTNKYGKSEHHATLGIAKELSVNNRVIDCIDRVGFSKIEGNYFSGSLEAKICNYADMRVSPHSVVSIKERLDDGGKRYQHRKDHRIDDDERREIFRKLQELEIQIFSKSKIHPEDISNKSISLIIEELKTYEI